MMAQICDRRMQRKMQIRRGEMVNLKLVIKYRALDA
jgi:hypothetical protein